MLCIAVLSFAVLCCAVLRPALLSTQWSTVLFSAVFCYIVHLSYIIPMCVCQPGFLDVLFVVYIACHGIQAIFLNLLEGVSDLNLSLIIFLQHNY